jgi:predicted benzoate:H+ symporter BenE
MSNVYAIGVIGVLLIGATALLAFIVFAINKKNAEVVTGVMGSVPVTTDFRMMTLLQIQVPVVVVSTTFAFLIGFAFLQIGDHVQDAAVARLASGCGFTYLFIAATFFLMGMVAVVAMVVHLRRLGEDPSHMEVDSRIEKDAVRKALLV